MGGPRAFCLAVIAFLIIVTPSFAADKFPLEGNEWLWCFGKRGIDSRLSSDLASSGIAGADLKWMSPQSYLVDDDGVIAGSAPYDSYNDMLSKLQGAYNDLESSARSQKAWDIYGKAKAIDGIGSGISKYGNAISIQIEVALRKEIERTGLQRVEEAVPLGRERTSAAKFYEKISDERASGAVRERSLAEVERLESGWAGYLGKYSEFAWAEHRVFLNLYNCSKFQVVSLARCNFDDASAWACFDFLGGCLPWMMCKEQFERDASRLKTSPPNVKETMANLKLHSPLSALKEKYSEFVGLMKKAKETESSLKAEDGRLADSVEGLLLKSDVEELWLINATIADKIRSVSKGNTILSSVLRAKPQAQLSSFSAVIGKTRESLKDDKAVLEKISKREEKYSEESGAFLYNRIKDLKGINDRLAGQTQELSRTFETALELEGSASAAVGEMKASLLGNEALWPLDRLRISNMAVWEEPIGRSVLTKYGAILELERIAKRTKETENAAIESQLEEIEGKTDELRLLLDVAGSPIERTFAGGMHGEGLGKLGKTASTLDGVRSDISKIRRSEDNAEKKLLLLSLGMKFDSALEELHAINDERHANSLNGLRFSVKKALDDAASAGIPADEERKKFSGYDLRFAGWGDWIESSRAFGFMGWLEGEYGSLLKSLNEKLDKSYESFFSGLPIEASYALQDPIIVADKPVLVRASFAVSNPSSVIGGRNRLYSTKLEWVPTEKIGSKNVIDGSEGIEGVYSGGDRLYLRAKYLKPHGTESAVVEYYAEPPVRATVASKSEKATGEKYSLEQNVSVICGINIPEIEVPIQSLPEGAGLKITVLSSNGRTLEWLKAKEVLTVKSSCQAGNHSIQLFAEFAGPIEVSVSREMKSLTAGGLVSNIHRLEMRNLLGIELRDVEMRHELPQGAGDAKVDGRSKSLAEGGALYWSEGRFAPYGSASATITFTTTTNSTDTYALLDQEIRSILDSLPKCDWESCCDVGKLLEEESGRAGQGDPVARYLAKSDFLSWLKKNSPFIEIFSMESAEYKDLASAKAEMCSLKVSKAIEAVRKAEAEKRRLGKEEKAAIGAKSLVLRREVRFVEGRLTSLQATAKAFPGLLGKEAPALAELKALAEDAKENLILAETEGNATRLSEAEAKLGRLRDGISSEEKEMADAIHDFSNQSNGKAFTITVPGNITARVEERFPGAIVQSRNADNGTRPPSEFEKSYSDGDYEGALRLALGWGLGKEAGIGTLSKDAKGKIALAASKLAELERLAKIKRAHPKGEAAGYLEEAKNAYGEGRFADASYLALYAYSKAEDAMSELAGLKTPIDLRPMAALALLLAAGFVVYNKHAVKHRPAKPKMTIKQNNKEDEDFFGELK